MRISLPSVSCMAICSLFTLAVPACSSSGSDTSGSDLPQDKDSFGKRFKIADNDVSGWKQDTPSSAYSLWTADNLTDKIDGAAPEYTSRGMRFAMYQEMVGPDPQLCTVVAMDFETDTQAASMFAHQKDLVGADYAIPSYDSNAAIGYGVLTGMTTFAHFGWVYIELTLDGYSDKASAAQVAASFLKVLEPKAK